MLPQQATGREKIEQLRVCEHRRRELGRTVYTQPPLWSHQRAEARRGLSHRPEAPSEDTVPVVALAVGTAAAGTEAGVAAAAAALRGSRSTTGSPGGRAACVRLRLEPPSESCATIC